MLYPLHTLLLTLPLTLGLIVQVQAQPEPEPEPEPELAPTPARIYPTPQQCELEPNYTQITNITYTKLQSGERIAKGSVEEGIIALPEVEGAYAILIKKGELSIYSYDATGRHYAKQTLLQLLHNPLLNNTQTAQRDPYPENFDEGIARLGKLPLGCIVDWPDLPYRGVVEGYYGRPWSHEDRKQQLAFYGRNKLNTYIWAPKDDPYHHGMDCRKPYPQAIAEQISELCEIAEKNHVKFIWAIHPADTIDWDKDDGQADLKALLSKLEQMYELGVRHFACFVDDSNGRISQASRQAELCNYIYQHFIEQHEELDTLLMCPTGYCKLWTPDTWLRELGQHLNPNIKPMWTGDTVIANITKTGQEWVSKALGRPTFIWWNWPCTDYKRQQLAMGRTYGLEQDPAIKSLLYGLVANPMEWAEASKIGLFGVADYCWNNMGFQSQQNWQDSCQRLYPSAAEALYNFCQHNSDLGRDNDGYQREESIHIQDAASQLRQALGHPERPQEATAQIHQEFVTICQAGTILQQAPELATLRAEIQAWFQLYTTMGRVGKHALQLIEPQLSGDEASKLSDLLRAWVAMQDAQHSELRPKVGTIILSPLVQDCAQTAADHYYQSISGHQPQPAANSIQFSSSKGDPRQGSDAIFDQNETSYWSQKDHQTQGDWYQFDLGSEQNIGQITLIMGGERPNDYPAQGQWSHSKDSENWQNIGSPTEGDRIKLSTGNQSIRTRYLRFTITQAKEDNWLSICQFSTEEQIREQAQSSIKNWGQLSILKTQTQIGINKQYEVATIKPKDNISLNTPQATKAQGITINLNNSKVLAQSKLELTLEDGTTHQQTLPEPEKGEQSIHIPANKLPPQRIRCIKLTYTGSKSAEIKLHDFAIQREASTPRSDQKAISDSNILSAWDASNMDELQLDIPSGCRQICIISTDLPELTVEGATLTQGDDNTIRHIALQEGATSITLRSPHEQKNALIYEIIFLPAP